MMFWRSCSTDGSSVLKGKSKHKEDVVKKDLYLLVVGLLFFLPAGVLAQITINSSDILGLIGKSQSLESDTSDGITINVGAAGANQSWDFRSLTLIAETLTLQFITPQGTPFANRVPQANFAQRGTLSSEPGSTFYNYSQVSSNEFRSLGAGAVRPGGSFFSLTSAQDVSPLPLQFGATWTSAQTDTLAIRKPAFLLRSALPIIPWRRGVSFACRLVTLIVCAFATTMLL
jgi:hypothetical protein